MIQIRWENIPETAQTFGFPRLIELSQCNKYFLKIVKISPMGHLNNAHHGIKILLRKKCDQE